MRNAKQGNDLNNADSLDFMSKFQCASHMSVPVLGFLKQSNTGNNRLGHKTRFPQKSSSSRNEKQDLNLFFLFFLVKVLFAERCLSRKPTRPCFDPGNKDTLLQHNSWSACAANVLRNTRGHLNNAYILLGFGFVVRHFENGMAGVMAGKRVTHTAHVQPFLRSVCPSSSEW